MAELINNDDIETVRQRARIDEVVGQYVQLTPASAGTLKGLCPFHDEKTPSFQVTPAKGLFYCFGCQEGGDVITFIRSINSMSFIEAVQFLADRYGVELRTDGGGAKPDQRVKYDLFKANQAAATFFAEQLGTDEAEPARKMLIGRNFNAAIAHRFGVGYAPKDGRALHNHLNRLGFPDALLVKCGLIREKGGWDYFQGRVIWPIKDSAGSVLGFGARRLFDDDRMPAKYINTPETPVYHKSKVLYGLDMARKNIGKKLQAVIVEGYTDVMAAHLAGVDTAVASCGTAFGADHARLIQRIIGPQGWANSEVIFTFDGDAAGQKAAQKVFEFDANFNSQTYVAIEPNGLDPCDLRIQHGDAAVRDLIGRRIALYKFMMECRVANYDLDRAEGRIQAMHDALDLVSSIRNSSAVTDYVRDVSTYTGVDPDTVRRELDKHTKYLQSGGFKAGSPSRGFTGGHTVANAAQRVMSQNRRLAATNSRSTGAAKTANGADRDLLMGSYQPSEQGAGDNSAMPGFAGTPTGSALDASGSIREDVTQTASPLPWPDAMEPALAVERGILKLMLQCPDIFDAEWNNVQVEDFRHPAYRELFTVIHSLEGSRGSGWVDRAQQASQDPLVKKLILELTVEPLLTDQATRSYAISYAATLQLQTVQRTLVELTAKLRRVGSDQQERDKVFSEILAWEEFRRELHTTAMSFGEGLDGI